MRGHWQTTAIAISVGLAGASTAAASPADARPTMEIVVLNQANVPATLLLKAQEHASLIYAEAGVDVVWVEPMSAARLASGRVHLVVSVSGIAPAKRPMVLGYASRSHHRSGGVSFAFFSRVKDFARVQHADVSQVLAYVIAHEIGHLLLSFDSHSDAGIMRAVWKRGDVAPAANDLMRFSDEQAERIRETLTVATGR
jgi:hypothetical protein